MGNIWEDIYQGPLSEIPWLKTDAAWLTSIIKSKALPRGKAIDLGCGTGVNSVALAKTGNFDTVLGLDISPTAIRHANNLAKQNSVNKICEFEVAKLPDFTPNSDYDLILDWAFIHCLKPSEHEAYAQLIKRLSKKGAFLLIRYFSQKDFDVNQFSIGPKDKVQVLKKNTVLGLLDGFKVLSENETFPPEQSGVILREMLLEKVA